MKLLAVLLKNREKIKEGLEFRIRDLENELVKVKSELGKSVSASFEDVVFPTDLGTFSLNVLNQTTFVALNGAEMERLKERQKKTVQVVNKV